jgi:3-dehydro-L-gulonate 2-dehydrogenase
VEGGFDAAGLPSKDPAAILASRRLMPVGFWKGSGLSLLLDLAAALVSGGDSVQGIGGREVEYGLSQVFIALDLGRLPDPDGMRARVEAFVDYLHAAEPESRGGRIYYPGERSALTRSQNLERGIPVEDKIWAEVRALAGD